MPSIIERGFSLAINPNGKQVAHKMPPKIQQMMRVFYYMGFAFGAGEVMAAGRLLDQTSQMMKIMEIMDCIQNDEAFLGAKKEDLVGPDPDDLPSIN